MGYLHTMVGRLSIVPKSAVVEKFRPNWAQAEYLDMAERQLATTGRIRIITLKARQLGISTVTEAVAYTLCLLHDNYQALVVSHEAKSSAHILNMTRHYWETDPYKPLYTPKYVSKTTLAWSGINSQISIATAKNKGSGRSSTIHFLHGSEVAFWDDGETLMTGLRQAVANVPYSGIVLESTANGIGNYFENQWNAAIAGDSEFTPMFFPWWKHPEYLGSYIGLPAYNLGDLDNEEKVIEQAFLKHDPHAMDRLAWRRWALQNLAGADLLKFHQEYPSTPEEAFISTGTNVFHLPQLQMVYEPQAGTRGRLVRNGMQVEFVEDQQGPVTIFKHPAGDRDWGRYLIGADPTSTTRGDFAVGQVISRRTLEQVAVLRARLDAGTFADQLFNLGLFYNTAVIAPEKTGPGGVTVGKLLGMNYPFIWRHAKIDKTPGIVNEDTYGWNTTLQTKHQAIGYLIKVVNDGWNRNTAVGFRLHDAMTFSEMKNYVTLENGTYGNANGSPNDDTVMAMAIAIICHFLEGPPPPYGAGEPDAPTPTSTPDWQNWS
jgi:hypothetical protein